jgi:hypothetical protein
LNTCEKSERLKEPLIRRGAERPKITGKPVLYFAYPFGEWSESAIHMLQVGGFKAAFQLAGKPSEKYPRYTIRRMIVDGRWSGVRLQAELNRTFTHNVY